MEELKIKDLIEIQKDKDKAVEFYSNHDIKIYVDKMTTSYFSPTLQDKNNFVLNHKTNVFSDDVRGHQSILYIPKKDLISIFPFVINTRNKNKNPLKFLSSIKTLLNKGLSPSTVEKALDLFQRESFDKMEFLGVKSTQLEIAQKALAIELQTEQVNKNVFDVIEMAMNDDKYYEKIKISNFTKLDSFVKFANKKLEEKKEDEISKQVDKNKYVLQYIISPADNNGLYFKSLRIYITKKKGKVFETQKGLLEFIDGYLQKEKFANSLLYKNKTLTLKFDNKKELLAGINDLETFDFFNKDEIYEYISKVC